MPQPRLEAFFSPFLEGSLPSPYQMLMHLGVGGVCGGTIGDRICTSPSRSTSAAPLLVTGHLLRLLDPEHLAVGGVTAELCFLGDTRVPGTTAFARVVPTLMS